VVLGAVSTLALTIILGTGLTPSLFGVGHVCVQFPLYEYLKIRAADRSGVEVENLATTDILVCSGAAKTIASMVRAEE
jgi:solute carrier family 25 folate transporter 32